MEPLLELADRITATVLLFERNLPPPEAGSSQSSQKDSQDSAKVTQSLTDATGILVARAADDYAFLQHLLDLYDPHGQEGSDSGDPLGWVLGKPPGVFTRIRREIAALRSWQGIKARVSGPQRPDDRTNEEKARARRVAAAEKALECLARRIRKFEDVVKTSTKDLPGPVKSAIEWRRGLSSDAMFDRISQWISSYYVTLDQRKDLAHTFLRPPTWTEGDPYTPLFLLERNITSRVDDILRSTRRQTLTRTSGHKDPEFQASVINLARSWKKPGSGDNLDLLLTRSSLRAFCGEIDVAVPFSLAFSDELDEIQRSRAQRWQDPIGRPQDSPGTPVKPAGTEELPRYLAERICLFGVALSGGGIRSATFSLGLLQAMADRNILPQIDIISSVSGGGYIATWLYGWIKRRGGIRPVQYSLQGFASSEPCAKVSPTGFVAKYKTAVPAPLPNNQDPRADHLRPVRLLREYARYLAPEDGLFSADTWTIGTTWLRNTALNFVVLLLFVASLLSVPRFLVFATLCFQLSHPQAAQSLAPFLASLWPGIPFLFICALIGGANLSMFGQYQQSTKKTLRGWNDQLVVKGTVLPLLAAGTFYTSALWNSRAFCDPAAVGLAFGALTFTSLVLMTALSFLLTPGKLTDEEKEEKKEKVKKVLLPYLFATGISSAVAGLLMDRFCLILAYLDANPVRGVWVSVGVGAPLMMAVLAVTVVAMLGVAGCALDEEQREWWSRLGAWLMIATLGWLVICAICFFVPLWLLKAGLSLKTAAAGLSWAAITAFGLKFAFSAKSQSSQLDRSQPTWQKLVLSIAPAVFVVGFLCATSFLIFLVTNPLLDELQSLYFPLRSFRLPQSEILCCRGEWFDFPGMITHYWYLLDATSALLVALPFILFLLSVELSERVDVNVFSMHHFYRNRLVRAYLGASRDRAHREPNAFTGFDPVDDIRLHRFLIDDKTDIRDLVSDCRASYSGPFPIINTALNITKGLDLGLQQRHAESFIFTPIWSGFDYTRKQTQVPEAASREFGFRCTRSFGHDGVYTGTAMAISGAAFSSNAGYHTSPPLAFLLTIFGVRLGWWAGNPRMDKWDKTSPSNSLEYLANELTASTSTDKDFVLLTDGGHFENMGLYELIRRRCRYIVIADAEQDELFKLEGIGGAVRKCRNDFGVVIDFDVDPLKPLGDPANSRLHHIVGTIRYPGEATCGMLLYIKASLTGDESVDLVEFRQSHPEFPHTPTINQMFDESHFESYRELGHHIGSKVFQRDWPERETDELCSYFRDRFLQIKEDWELEKCKAERKHRKACQSFATRRMSPAEK